ncbi:MAG: hypothetical protein U0793_11440 [Gemmataceae bacterium]
MNFDLVKLLIPIIALVVWIVANIIGNVQQQGQRGPRRQQPKPPPKPTTGNEEQRDIEEQDRKAEETRKKRKAQVDRQFEVERQRQVESDKERRRAGSLDRPSEKVVIAQDRPRVDRGPEAAPQRVPVPPPRPAAVPVVREVLPTPKSLQVSATSLSAALGEAAKVKERPLAPAAQEVRRLLKNPGSLAAAIALREILDPPLVRRRRS